MKTTTLTLLLAITASVCWAGEPADNDKKAHDIIAKKCTGCHGEAKVTAAFKAGRDMRAIQKDMQKRGAGLTGKEQEVLNIFWKQKPLK
jgi:hypothetical protein